jgi:DNA-binding beta-propeller fold protein YncE
VLACCVAATAMVALAACGPASSSRPDGGSAERRQAAKLLTVTTIPVGGAPTDVVVESDAVWIATAEAIVRVDPDANRVVAQVDAGTVDARVPGGGQAVAAGREAVWVANPVWTDSEEAGKPSAAGGVVRIDPRTNEVAATVIFAEESPTDVAVGEGAVWVVANRGEGTVSRIDPETNRIVAVIKKSPFFAALAVGEGAAWVAGAREGTVRRIDARTNRVTAVIPVIEGIPAELSAIAVGAGAVWVTGARESALIRIDPGTNRVDARIPLGVSAAGARAVAASEEAVWVAAEGALLRIDPGTNEVTARVALGPSPSALAVGEGAVWVTDFQEGTLRRISAEPLR